MFLLWGGVAAAATLDVGAGLARVAPGFDGAPRSVVLKGLYPLGDRSILDGSLAVRLPSESVVSDATSLAQSAYNNGWTDFVVPVERELATISASVGLSPWTRPEAGGDAWAFGSLCLDARFVREDRLRPTENPTPTEGELDTRFSPGVGVGMEYRLSDRVALRVEGRVRASLQLAPDYGLADASGSPVPREWVVVGSRVGGISALVRL